MGANFEDILGSQNCLI